MSHKLHINVIDFLSPFLKISKFFSSSLLCFFPKTNLWSRKKGNDGKKQEKIGKELGQIEEGGEKLF